MIPLCFPRTIQGEDIAQVKNNEPFPVFVRSSDYEHETRKFIVPSPHTASGGQLILKEYDNDDIVDIAEVSASSVKNWRRKLRQSDGALHALARKKGAGRQPKLNDVQKQQLKEIILNGAAGHIIVTRPVERWTSKIVADLIRRVFHVNLAASSVRRILRSLGLSPQMPVVKSHKYSEEAVLEWAKRTWLCDLTGTPSKQNLASP